MKRALDFSDSHKSGIVNEDLNTRIKYQTLLQDYLDLQKEFVSKKKKLQEMKQRWRKVQAEVGFLSKRHNYLLRIKNQKQDFSENGPLETKKSLLIKEDDDVEDGVLMGMKLSRLQEKPLKNLLSHGKNGWKREPYSNINIKLK